jgi:hypothetical protein
MAQKTKKKSKPSVLSRAPWKRRSEAEMVKIVREIQAGVVKKKEACRKYGLNRNTLVSWMRRLSVRTLQLDECGELTLPMTEKQHDRALQQKIKDLTRALEQAHLKNEGLETMIKVAEEELQIKIRKKRGTKQSSA